MKVQRVGRGCGLIAAMVISGCAHGARLPVAAGTGPTPNLPAPSRSLIPTVKVATAIGWGDTAGPTPAPGLSVKRFASGFQHPRWLYVLPNGDVLVAETNAPDRPLERKGIRNWIMGKLMRKAGAAVPSANRITLLRDADGDGVAEQRFVFRDGLNSPFGMTLVNGTMYIADTDALLRIAYTTGATSLTGVADTVVRLPAGPRNHHWTKNVIASGDGKRLYVTVGSNSNVAEHGIAAEQERAAIWEVNPATGAHRIFASGLRNPNGLAWDRTTGLLWAVVNERDELGSDLVPDYMTAVHDGDFYGWPFSYYGQHIDSRVKPANTAMVARAIAPDYALGPHTASLGLATADGATSFPASMREGMFVGQHGSWNRTPRSGYKVIFVPFRAGRPAGDPIDILTDFLTNDGAARGRPVGVAVDSRGGVLVADDVGNMIWRVTGGAGR